jgi:hypothetical protein
MCAAALVGLLAVATAGCEDTTTTPTPSDSTATLLFISQLMQGGSTTRSFTTARSGEVKVTFTSLSPDSGVTVRVGLGSFDSTSNTCTLSSSVSIHSGNADPIITATLGAGTHCVQIADTANVLSKTNDFTITVTYPYGS